MACAARRAEEDVGVGEVFFDDAMERTSTQGARDFGDFEDSSGKELGEVAVDADKAYKLVGVGVVDLADKEIAIAA